MDRFTPIYYINLNHRTDRREQFEDWIAYSGLPLEKVQRIEAIWSSDRPHLACGMSHIKAVETFIASKQPYGFIFEDDYLPIEILTFWDTVQKVLDSGVNFDVFLGSYNQLESSDTEYPFLKRVHSSMTASCYLVTREYAPTLRKCLIEGIQLAIQEEEITKVKTDQYMNDVYWQKLMKQDTWVCYYPRLGKQRPSYSDLQRHFTEYEG